MQSPSSSRDHDHQALADSAWDPAARPADPFVAWLDRSLSRHRAGARVRRRLLHGFCAAGALLVLLLWLQQGKQSAAKAPAEPEISTTTGAGTESALEAAAAETR